MGLYIIDTNQTPKHLHRGETFKYYIESPGDGRQLHNQAEALQDADKILKEQTAAEQARNFECF